MSVFSRSVRRSETTGVKPVNLKLVKINFWSVVRFAFVLTVALGIGLVIAMTIIFFIMNLTGFSNLLKSFVGQEVSLPAVLSLSLSIALFNILVGTTLAGVYAVIFNIVARITGGVSVGFTNN
ncbi:MAG: DUF3566 domain-containing protein [Micrococcales bacterium]|nr:DUF3566 domain-containing protein [Micrococcales bacterium]NBR61207.1 DUF3566 domain-containing protein [Actinomycetota bacterium]NBS61330.1 DUF3566 domain-containing protein [Microbacteriaceae bacterium]NBT48790.1 DUF3566 domain-containing protein [Actinomycetota bacterium]NBY43686.1 DUF3566 domain-containing protein [Micrococcales bacterium]